MNCFATYFVYSTYSPILRLAHRFTTGEIAYHLLHKASLQALSSGSVSELTQHQSALDQWETGGKLVLHCSVVVWTVGQRRDEWEWRGRVKEVFQVIGKWGRAGRGRGRGMAGKEARQEWMGQAELSSARSRVLMPQHQGC